MIGEVPLSKYLDEVFTEQVRDLRTGVALRRVVWHQAASSSGTPRRSW